MAIYHLETTPICRAKGQSAIAAAAYRAAEKLYDKNIDKMFDYRRKLGVDFKTILLPSGAASEFMCRAKLWNEAELRETRRNSRTAREFTISLPVELSNQVNIKMVEKFCQRHFADKGLACDICFHHLNSDNPHAHILTSTRELVGKEFTQKARWINSKSYLMDLRKDWEVCQNKELAIAGVDHTVTCESYKTRGLDIVGLDARFNKYDRTYVERLKQENTATILKNIDIIPSILTDMKAVITEYDINRFVDRNVSEEYIVEVKEKIYQSINLVELEKGKYTSISYFQREKELFENLDKIDNFDKSKFVEPKFVEEVSWDMGLSDEQERAVEYVTNTDSNIKNIQGYAGSGKSYTVKAIAKVFDQSGFRNRGLALSGQVADNLSKDCGISNSSTIASFLNGYEKGFEKIDKKTVLYVDEISLVGTVYSSRIIEIAHKHGAKLVNVGDDNQASAISAGGASRAIFDNTSSCTLSENRRQLDHLDKQATLDFSTGKTEKAIRYYHDKGAVIYHDTKKDLYSNITSQYVSHKSNDKSSVVLATTNNIVDQININIQHELKARGQLGDNHIHINGKNFYEKDRFMFLGNSRDLNIKNSNVGTIEKIKGNELQILLDGKEGRTINFNIQNYKSFDLGYSLTVHKAQGVSVDKVEYYLDQNTNNNLSLVGCTRHKEDLTVHCSKDLEKGIGNVEQLVKAVTKKSTKELVSDYEFKITKQYIDKNSELPIPIKQGKDLEQAIKLDIAIKQTTKELDIAKAKLQAATSYEQRIEYVDDVTTAQKAINTMESTKELYATNIDKHIDKLSLEDKYKNAFNEIKDADKKLKLEANREVQNIKNLEKIIKLDNQAKQTFKEAKYIKITTFKNYADFNAQYDVKKEKELKSKELFDERNELLKEFDKYKDVVSDKVKETDIYSKVNDINNIQLEHLQKEISQEKQIDNSMEMEFDYN